VYRTVLDLSIDHLLRSIARSYSRPSSYEQLMCLQMNGSNGEKTCRYESFGNDENNQRNASSKRSCRRSDESLVDMKKDS
jgi:hypothetical protein